MDPALELRAILNHQLQAEARIQDGNIEDLLTDSEYRDSNDEYLFDINGTDFLGNTALHFAVQSGSAGNVAHLIEADGCDVDLPNSAGDTPLHLAVQIKDPKIRRNIVFILVKTAGATDSIRLTNKAGHTPNALAKIYFPNDTEVHSLTMPPVRRVSDILGKDDIASDGEGDA